MSDGVTIQTTTAPAALPQGYLFGGTLTNDAGDLTNDISFATGRARDSTNVDNLVLASALIKQLDAAWAVGTNAGGRMSAAAIANTTYHCFLIKRVDTGVVDCGFDVSATAPTMPANYTLFRRIGSIIRVGGAIVGFIQTGDTFMKKVATQDVASTNPGTSAVTNALAIPLGLKLTALVQNAVVTTTTGATYFSLLTDLDATDSTPAAATSTTRLTSLSTAGTYAAQAPTSVVTDTSAQIRSRLSTSDAATTIVINTLGWIDGRGRLA